MEDLRINDYQKSKYVRNEEFFFQGFSDILAAVKQENKRPAILDIGCGNGSVLRGLDSYFEGQADLSGIDTTEFDSWPELQAAGIHLLKLSAFALDEGFTENTFDIIICNGVIHHLIVPGISRTITVQDQFLSMVRRVLKPDGLFLVTECTLESYVGNASTYIHSFLTRLSIPPLAALIRKIGAKSAGVGTFFRSLSALHAFFERNGFQIVTEKPPQWSYRFPGLKGKIASAALLCREHTGNICLVLKPNETA